MPDALASALATPGLGYLLAAALVSGVVYGFSGFGVGLVFVPLAALFVPPGEAVLLVAVFGLVALVTILPRAWAVADRSEALTLVGAALVTLPAGTWLLTVVPDVPLRWAILAVVSVTLVALLAGWRYRATPGLPTRLGVGAATGVLGGATGLVGPIVILFQLSGPGDAERVRATTLVMLSLVGAVLAPLLILRGVAGAEAIWLGALLMPACMIGTRIGQGLFRPERERLYRHVAHAVIALAILAGLPLWD